MNEFVDRLDRFEALMGPELADLAVDVVLGLQSPHRQAVAELVAEEVHRRKECVNCGRSCCFCHRAARTSCGYEWKNKTAMQ